MGHPTESTGNYQVIIDLQQDRQFVPDVLLNKRELFVAAGSVDAVADLSAIPQDAFKISSGATSVTITIPASLIQLTPPTLDTDKTYLYATQEGLINRVGDIFGNNAADEQKLYQLAQQKLAAAALDSNLRDRAEKNITATLTPLIDGLGYQSATVQFSE